ncbi:MAG: class I SAM-dependent methyltransferase [Acidimicrobiales bacterium]
MTHTAPAPSADADDASDPSAAPVGDGWGAERASGLDDERWSAVQRARLLAGKVLGGAPSDDDPDRVASKRELFMLFLSEEDDPEPFYVKLAERSVAEFEFPLDGRRVLDLGSGPGYYSRAMQRRGAQVTAIDLGEENMRSAAAAGVRVAYADGTVLPFADRSFDGVLCSNMLEHTPTPEKIFDEIERVRAPGCLGELDELVQPVGRAQHQPDALLRSEAGQQAVHPDVRHARPEPAVHHVVADLHQPDAAPRRAAPRPAPARRAPPLLPVAALDREGAGPA